MQIYRENCRSSLPFWERLKGNGSMLYALFRHSPSKAPPPWFELLLRTQRIAILHCLLADHGREEHAPNPESAPTLH
jgi:hypothetical protein